MATILAHIRVRDGAEAQFESIARALHDATHAQESGVRRYEYWRGADERTYYSLLAFDDHHAFLVHQTSDHHEAAAPQLREVVEAIRLEWIDPVQGASALPSTESQGVAPDADPLTREYAIRFAAEVAGWWERVR